MPIYEYKCPHCGCKFEYLESFTAERQTRCPECGKMAFRQLSTGTGVVMDSGMSSHCERTSPCCGRDELCDKRPCD